MAAPPAADELHEIRVETRLEAVPTILAVVVGQVVLALQSHASGWELSGLPWWHWLVPAALELVLVAALIVPATRDQLARLGHHRRAALLLVGVIGIANGVSLAALIGSLVNGHEHSGGELLLKGFTIWATNVVVFGLWFWEVDGGGPLRRRRFPDSPRDFQFPQQENPTLAAPGWHPRLFDYVYVAFTNAIAFSPTDAMPLSRHVKLLMLIESAASAVTVLLVAARAVNILR